MPEMIDMQEKLDCHRGRKLRRATKAAMRAIVICRHATVGAIKNFSCEHLARRFNESDAPQFAQHRSGRVSDLIRLRTISLGNAQQDARKASHVVAIFRWKISAAIKRDAVGC